MFSHFRCIRHFAILWTVACDAPLSMGILQARMLKWVAISSSRESSQTRDWICISYVSCIGRQVLYTSTTWEAPLLSSVRSLSCVPLFAVPWAAECQASLPFTNSQSLLKLMPIESVMPSNHFILCHPLLLLPSIFPSMRVFPMSQVFASGGQSSGASASGSVLLMNIQCWFPLWLTDLISLQSKGLSRSFSSTPSGGETVVLQILMDP